MGHQIKSKAAQTRWKKVVTKLYSLVILSLKWEGHLINCSCNVNILKMHPLLNAYGVTQETGSNSKIRSRWYVYISNQDDSKLPY